MAVNWTAEQILALAPDPSSAKAGRGLASAASWVTSGRNEVAAWGECPIARLFDSTVISCHVGCVKPEPEIYQISLRELGVEAREAVFVGDGGSSELEGARNVGLTTVMIAGVIREIWPERIPERRRHADFVIERLGELFG